MKRSITFILLAGIVVMTACTREADNGKDIPNGIHHAYIQEVETRTGFDIHDGKFSWTRGDQIAIHMSDGTWHNTEVDYKTGAFNCETSDACYRNAYAIYPASIVDPDNIGDPVLNIILPSEYDISSDLSSNVAPLPMVAVNDMDESDLYFCHVGGLLRIACNAVPAGTRRIAVTLDRNIAGTFTVSRPESSTPSISSGGNTNKVYFKVSENGLPQKTDGIILNLPVPTGTYSSLTVTPYDSNGDAIDTFDRAIGLPVVRQLGKRFRFALTEVITDSMQLVVTAGDETGWEYTLPFYRYSNFPADLEIDWGDGSTTAVSAGTRVETCYSDITHSYSSAGDYTITVTGTREGKGALIPAIWTWEHQVLRYSGYDSMLISVPTPLLRVDSYSLYYAFANCLSLKSICPDLFSKNGHIDSLTEAFYNCHNLQTIPAGLFDYLPDITSFQSIFWMDTWRIQEFGFTPSANILSCGIPDGLFDYNTKVTSFTQAFTGCDGLPSIPEGLFKNNQEAREFNGTFSGCSGITTIPLNLFSYNSKATTFDYTFSGCSGISGNIPENLFDNNTAVTSFNGTFRNCTGLTGSIPEGIFANNINATSITETFSGCTGLTGSIPENLFANNPKVTSFYCVFSLCNGLSGSIPEDLFANQSQVLNFSRTFQGCSSLTGSIPQTLFSTNPSALYFESTFGNCEGLTGSIPAELFSQQEDAIYFYSTFCECHNLSGLIPSDLFANNLKAYYFTYCFSGCYKLKVNPDIFLPTTRFSQMTETCHFYSCFNSCGRDLEEGGTAPELWKYSFGNGVESTGCFWGATTLSNYNEIDPDWK